MIFFILSVLCFTFSTNAGKVCEEKENERWSYGGRNGPKRWSKTFPTCSGRMQSPIDLLQESVVKSWGELPRFYNYNIPLRGRVENTGTTIEITPTDGVNRVVVVDGTNFTLREMHFHFGSNKRSGSEHVRDGRRVAMEMHLVHESRDRRTAVFAILFKESSYNPAIQSIIYAVSDVTYMGDEASFSKKINLQDILPKCETTFYRYWGSLTTPPCTEGVIWTVFKVPNGISNDQFQAFAQQRSTSRTTPESRQCFLEDNVRPLQRLNGRQVKLYNPGCDKV